MRALIALVLATGVARADAFDRLAEGAPAYAALRPVALIGALKRLGVDELPEVKKLRQQLGGLDPLDPALLAPSGLDVAAPLAGSFFEVLPGGRVHHRVVATVRDKMLFAAFLMGLAASGKVPLQAVDAASPAGKLGVTTTAKLPGLVAILRLDGDTAIVDAFESKQPAPAAEIARKVPLTPKRPFAAEKGARRLFSPDGAAVAYLDGRRLTALLTALDEKPSAPNCRDWAKAPSTFDDVALALAVEPDQVALELGWGTQAGAPLGGLKFSPRDDNAVDAGLLSRIAPVMLAIYAASLAPYERLPHPGAFASLKTLSRALDKCSAGGAASLIVRSWPNAIATLMAEGDSTSVKAPSQLSLGGSQLSMALSVFGQLRNLVIAVRDWNEKTARFAATSTFDPSAQQLLVGLLQLLDPEAEAKTIGSHSVKLYRGGADQGLPLVGALETIGTRTVALTIADSEESLAWAFRSASAMPGAKAPAPPVPAIFSLHLDGAEVAKLLQPLTRPDVQSLLDFLARLRRLDADARADGDLFRLTVRAPVKQ
jgi:hypothetical protein